VGGAAKLTGITGGPDGNVWFVDGTAIGRITPAGTINTFTPSTGATARGGDDDIGEITTGGTITEFSASAGPGVDGLVVADGLLWLSAGRSGAGLGTIDQVNTSTGALESYYSPVMVPDFDPQGLAADSHGNLYFTLDGGAELNTGGPRIGIGEYMDPGPGGTVTAYAAGLQTSEESDPTAIAAGPDGNMYFVDEGESNGGRDELGELNITTHAITEFSSGLAGASAPSAITGGPTGTSGSPIREPNRPGS